MPPADALASSSSTLRVYLPRALVSIACVVLAHVVHARVTAGGIVTEPWQWPADRVREKEAAAARVTEARALVAASSAAANAASSGGIGAGVVGSGSPQQR